MRRFLNLLLTAALVTTTACSDATGPDEPDVPDLSGVWTGTFGNSSLRMSLSQRGAEVTGTLSVGSTGRRNFEVTGTVDGAGTFQWNTDQLELDCSVYSSGGMQLQSSASELSGSISWVTETPPCGDGRRRVARGLSTLTRAF
jgi:hypothetical protein